jgi:hypothetical protein
MKRVMGLDNIVRGLQTIVRTWCTWAATFVPTSVLNQILCFKVVKEGFDIDDMVSHSNDFPRLFVAGLRFSRPLSLSPESSISTN